MSTWFGSRTTVSQHLAALLRSLSSSHIGFFINELPNIFHLLSRNNSHIIQPMIAMLSELTIYTGRRSGISRRRWRNFWHPSWTDSELYEFKEQFRERGINSRKLMNESIFIIYITYAYADIVILTQPSLLSLVTLHLGYHLFSISTASCRQMIRQEILLKI
jgi:hypothetical protein